MSLRTSKYSEQAPDSSLEDIEYRRLFHQAPERKIIIKTDHSRYTCVEVTDSFLALTGTSRAQVLGSGYFDLFGDTLRPYKRAKQDSLLRKFQTIIQNRTSLAEVMRYDLVTASGETQERYLNIRHFPVCDDSGAVAYIVQKASDITTEIMAERSANEIREQLQEALDIGKVGSWVWDIENDTVVADANLAKLFGVSKIAATTGIPIGTFTGAIHPGDQKRVEKAIQRAVRTKSDFEEEYRTVGKKGEVRWVLARGRVKIRGKKRIFPGVIVDITEQRKLQAQVDLARQQDILNRQSAKVLQERNEELEDVNRTKDEFVALASHQLRTPATAVKQYIGMVLQGYAGDISEVQTDMLEKAFESNERQIQIINQILNAARVDTGKLTMLPLELNIGDQLKAIVNDMQQIFTDRGQTLQLSVPQKPLFVRADRGYLRMAIENVIHNACIYTHPGGNITITVRRAGTYGKISVTDTGVGIKKADLKRLFAKFSRIHNIFSVEAGGSGIGLYLTAEIVRLHGGTVSVESKIHQGTTFAISLPLVP